MKKYVGSVIMVFVLFAAMLLGCASPRTAEVLAAPTAMPSANSKNHHSVTAEILTVLCPACGKENCDLGVLCGAGELPQEVPCQTGNPPCTVCGAYDCDNRDFCNGRDIQHNHHSDHHHGHKH